MCYERGDGVEQDFHLAVQYYNKAVELGYLQSLCNLGNLYYKGQGVEQNFEKACELWQRAVDNGIKEAQRNLDLLNKKNDEQQKYNDVINAYLKAVNDGEDMNPHTYKMRIVPNDDNSKDN